MVTAQSENEIIYGFWLFKTNYSTLGSVCEILMKIAQLRVSHFEINNKKIFTYIKSI